MAAKRTTRKPRAAMRAQSRAARPATASGAADNPWINVGEGAHLHIGDFLTFQLIRLANAAKANVTRQYLADFGLSVPEWRLLAMTIRFEPVRFSELVAKSSMDKGQASRTLQALTRRGLIAARDAGTGGKRASDSSAPVILTVTSKGRRLYATALPVAQRNQARLLMLLTRDERKQLYVILNKLHGAIGGRDPLD
jgi:DNA-binding MarR family transcriptional regulator